MKNDISQSLGLDLVNINVTQKSIKIFSSVQEIRPFSLFQNLALGKASTDDKCHFAIVSLFSFDNLKGYILSISMCIQNFITIFHSVQEIGPLSPFAEFGARQSLDR